MTREEAIETLTDLYCAYTFIDEWGKEKRDAIKMGVEALKGPERRKGKWINCGIIYAGTAGYAVFRCSECNESNFKRSRFCPNCGTRMEEEE